MDDEQLPSLTKAGTAARTPADLRHALAARMPPGSLMRRSDPQCALKPLSVIPWPPVVAWPAHELGKTSDDN